MSQAEEDSALVGVWLAELVDEGKITDADAMGYLAGDKLARKKVRAVLEENDDG